MNLIAIYEEGFARGYGDWDAEGEVPECPYPECSVEADRFYLGYNAGCQAYYEDNLSAEPDSMDGDFDSAMTSAGFGTDEDYGYNGEE